MTTLTWTGPSPTRAMPQFRIALVAGHAKAERTVTLTTTTWGRSPFASPPTRWPG